MGINQLLVLKLPFNLANAETQERITGAKGSAIGVFVFLLPVYFSPAGSVSYFEAATTLVAVISKTYFCLFLFL